MMFSNVVRRRAALALLACASLSGSACAPGAAAPGAKKKASAKKPSAPPNMSAVVQSPTVTIGDPKLPGKLLAVVKAATFDAASASQGALGNMTQVRALLYQKGKPAATLAAPRARGGQNSAAKSLVMTATGGVVVVSLTEPGRRLTADTVVWDSSTNKIVATGHAVYHDGKTAVTVQSPTIIADTKLKSVGTGPGHLSGTF